MLGVLIAVKDEAAAILANAAYRWEKQPGGTYYSAPKQLILSVCGIGKANAAFALGQMFARADEVIMFGTAGGLGPEKTGSLYLCSEFVEHDMSADIPGLPTSAVIACSASRTLERIREICRQEKLALREGRVLSGDQFIHDQESADAKAAQFGGQLIDMESAAAAKICRRFRKSFCAVRYVTDKADRRAQTAWQENVKTAAELFDRILVKF